MFYLTSIRFPGTTIISVTFNDGPAVIDGVTYNAGNIYTVVMQQYQVLNILHNILGDPDPPIFTGSVVVASQPVACMSGSAVSNVGDPYGTMDHLAEQLSPVENWGTKFALASSPTRKSGDVFRAHASEPDTNVTIHRSGGISSTHTIQTGGFQEIVLGAGEHAILTSDIAIAVFHFAMSWNVASGSRVGGDPSLSYVPPLQQWTPRCVFRTPTGFTGINDLTHFVNIIIKKSKRLGILWNDHKLPGIVHWKNLPDVEGLARLAVAEVQIKEGLHEFHHEDPTVSFLVMAYGLSPYGAYGTVAGSRAAPINMVNIIIIK